MRKVLLDVGGSGISGSDTSDFTLSKIILEGFFPS